MTPSGKTLSAAEMDLWVPTLAEADVMDSTQASDAGGEPEEPDMATQLATICDALIDRYGGVILRGPPGTGKSHYANQIAVGLTDGDEDRHFRVQFHPSYQYEDFVEGYVPISEGEFALRDRTLKLACNVASAAPKDLVVLVIDELSRVDCARVFGEAFTYIERTKRGMKCLLSSGSVLVVPKNLFIICTMNDRDAGVDTVDAAFERRFAMVEVGPDARELVSILSDSTLSSNTRSAVLSFFREANAGVTGGIGLGHAYFYGVKTAEDLQRLWNHQLKFVVRRALSLDPERFVQLNALWQTTVESPVSSSS
jgi:5-methylcytosine-specific restriction protein B